MKQLTRVIRYTTNLGVSVERLLDWHKNTLFKIAFNIRC